MAKVLDFNTDHVTLGVLDKDLHLAKELVSVTYADLFGTVHTVNAHRDGPFQKPEDIIAAHLDGILHTFESHKDAAAYERDRGNHTIADRLDALSAPDTQRQSYSGGEG